MPKLQVKNLGLSTLAKEGQAKTQEELDVMSRVQEESKSRAAAAQNP